MILQFQQAPAIPLLLLLAAEVLMTQVDACVENCNHGLRSNGKTPGLGAVDIGVRDLIEPPLAGEKRIVGKEGATLADEIRLGELDLRQGEKRSISDGMSLFSGT